MIVGFCHRLSSVMEKESAEEVIQRQLENLGLEEEERGRVVDIEDDDIDETDKDFLNSLACKILSCRTINPKGFASLMPKIWGLSENVRIEKAGRNLFLCKFRHQRFKNRVLREGPWSFATRSWWSKNQKEIEA